MITCGVSLIVPDFTIFVYGNSPSRASLLSFSIYWHPQGRMVCQEIGSEKKKRVETKTKVSKWTQKRQNLELLDSPQMGSSCTRNKVTPNAFIITLIIKHTQFCFTICAFKKRRPHTAKSIKKWGKTGEPVWKAVTPTIPSLAMFAEIYPASAPPPLRFPQIALLLFVQFYAI